MQEMYFSDVMINPGLREGFYRSSLKHYSNFDKADSGLIECPAWLFSEHPRQAGDVPVADLPNLGHEVPHLQRRSDLYLVQLLTDGRICGDYDGRKVNAFTDQIILTDLERPVVQDINVGRRISIAIQKSEIDGNLKKNDIHGLILTRGNNVVQLLSIVMQGIVNLENSMSYFETISVRRSLIILLKTAMCELEIINSSESVSFNFHSIKNKIIDYIDENILSRNLSVLKIQQEFNISRAHLYRLFEAEGGISGYIKNRRLDYVYQNIASGKYSTSSAKKIAYDCGFNSPECFNRQFRKRFGSSPKEMVRADRLSEGCRFL